MHPLRETHVAALLPLPRGILLLSTTYVRCKDLGRPGGKSLKYYHQDWRNHKVACRKASRPVLEALLFPGDGLKPVLVKIPYTSKVDTDGYAPTPYHDLDSETLKRYLPRGLEMKYVSKLGRQGRLLDRALVVIYGSDFQLDGSLNQCIVGLTGGRISVPWAGNVLVLRQQGRLYSETYESATMEDVAAMSRFFEEYEDFVPYAF